MPVKIVVHGSEILCNEYFPCKVTLCRCREIYRHQMVYSNFFLLQHGYIERSSQQVKLIFRPPGNIKRSSVRISHLDAPIVRGPKMPCVFQSHVKILVEEAGRNYGKIIFARHLLGLN